MRDMNAAETSVKGMSENQYEIVLLHQSSVIGTNPLAPYPARIVGREFSVADCTETAKD